MAETDTLLLEEEETELKYPSNTLVDLYDPDFVLKHRAILCRGALSDGTAVFERKGQPPGLDIKEGYIVKANRGWSIKTKEGGFIYIKR